MMKQNIFFIILFFTVIFYKTTHAILQKNGFFDSYDTIDELQTDFNKVLWTADGMAYKKNGVRFVTSTCIWKREPFVFCSIWSKKFNPQIVYIPVIMFLNQKSMVIKVFKIAFHGNEHVSIKEADSEDVIVYAWAFHRPKKHKKVDDCTISGLFNQIENSLSGDLFSEQLDWFLGSQKKSTDNIFIYSQDHNFKNQLLFLSTCCYDKNNNQITIPYCADYNERSAKIKSIEIPLLHQPLFDHDDACESHHRVTHDITINIWSFGLPFSDSPTLKNNNLTYRCKKRSIITDYESIFWITDKISYIKTGITIEYPDNLFLDRPHIIVSTIPKNKTTYSNQNILYIPELTSNKSIGSKIRIHKMIVESGKIISIDEAETDDADCCIWALG